MSSTENYMKTLLYSTLSQTPRPPRGERLPPSTVTSKNILPITPPTKIQLADASNSQTVNQSVTSADIKHQHKPELKKYRDIFQCDTCKQEGQGERYRCDGCNKEFHDECRSFLKTEARHKHKYEFRSYNKIFQCIGCKKEGFGGRFRCDLCGDELHPQCRFPKDEVGIGWLPGHTFKFQKQPESEEGLVCNACAMDIKGYFYTNYVESCGGTKRLNFHPCCINLNPVLNAGLDVPDEDEQKYILKDKAPPESRCYLCQKKELKHATVPGWSYVCACGDYCFHVRCVQEKMREACVNDNIVGVQKALNYASTSKHVAKSQPKGGRHPGINVVKKIFKVILNLIASTLLGDPTFGLVHVFKILFLD